METLTYFASMNGIHRLNISMEINKKNEANLVMQAILKPEHSKISEEARQVRACLAHPISITSKAGEIEDAIELRLRKHLARLTPYMHLLADEPDTPKLSTPDSKKTTAKKEKPDADKQVGLFDSETTGSN